jgi:hypothetical protein
MYLFKKPPKLGIFQRDEWGENRERFKETSIGHPCASVDALPGIWLYFSRRDDP